MSCRGHREAEPRDRRAVRWARPDETRKSSKRGAFRGGHSDIHAPQGRDSRCLGRPVANAPGSEPKLRALRLCSGIGEQIAPKPASLGLVWDVFETSRTSLHSLRWYGSRTRDIQVHGLVPTSEVVETAFVINRSRNAPGQLRDGSSLEASARAWGAAGRAVSLLEIFVSELTKVPASVARIATFAIGFSDSI